MISAKKLRKLQMRNRWDNLKDEVETRNEVSDMLTLAEQELLACIIDDANNGTIRHLTLHWNKIIADVTVRAVVDTLERKGYFVSVAHTMEGLALTIQWSA